MRKSHLLLVAVLALAPMPAAAQVKLTLADGKATLVATQATPRQILTEWARIGQTRIVNVERLTGAPISLELTDVPEKQALDIILRSSSGYLAAPRPAAVPNASYYDRIFVIPGSPQPRTASSSAPPMLPQPRQQAFPTEPDFDPAAGLPATQRPPIVTPPPAGAPLVPAAPALVPAASSAPLSNAPPPSTPSIPTGARAPGMIVQPPPQQAPGTITPPGRPQ